MKKRLTGATFDASAQTVVHADFSDITLAGIQLIVNVTDQIIIYNFADTAKGGTLATDTLTLEHDTTSMSDTDELMILVEDAVTTQAVSAASLPLPSGASTSAKQDTIIGHLDGVEGLLTTIDADTGTLAGAVSGSEMQVDIVSMPAVDTELTTADMDTGAGTATRAVVGLLSAESGGPVLVGTASGLPINLVADAIGLALESGGNLESIVSNTSNNALETGGNLDDIATDTGNISSDTSSLATTVYSEDLAFQDGDPGIAAMAVRTDTPANRSGTDGDYEPLQLSAGRLWTSAKIDTALPAGTNNIGDIDVLTVPADPFGANADAASATGSISAKLRFIASTGIPITGTVTVGSHAVTNAGTFAVQDATAQASLSVMDDWDNGASDGASVSGDVAHDTADAGEPVKIGMKAVALKANPTEVAAGDRTNWYADVSGVPFMLGGHPNILSQSLQVTDADGAQTDAAIITAGANVAIVVTKVSVMADNANTGDVSVRIGFGTANTPAADAAQMLLFHPGIVKGSGVVEGNGAGIIGIGASGEDVRVTCEDPAGGSINIIVTYFTTEI